MSNTITNLQTQTSNVLHNAIMEAGGKDRPPMLAPGNYVQWKFIIKRYIDTKPNNELIHYCLQNPPYKFKWTEKTVPVVEGSSETITEGYMENYKNVSQDIRDQLNAEAETCDVTNHQVNVRFLLQLQSEWQGFMTLVKQSQELKTVSYHKVYDILKQHQKNRGKAIVNSPQPTYDSKTAMVAEDDELSKEKEIDKQMALISLSFKKIYKPTNNNIRTSSNTSRANQDNTPIINRGTRYDIQRVVNVAGARENVGTKVVQQSRIQCYNCKEYFHVIRECQKPKRVKDTAYHKEKMLLCKQEEAVIQLSAEKADWRDDTDDELDDQELEAHYMYIAQIQEVTRDDADNSGSIFDAEPLQKVQNNDDNYNVFAIESEHPEQPEYDNDDLAKERDLLASLIAKLKCEIDDSKNRNKLLESSNKILVDKLTSQIEAFKNKNKCLESSNIHFKEANDKLRKTNQMMFKDLKKFQDELEKRHDVNYMSKVELDCAKAKACCTSRNHLHNVTRKRGQKKFHKTREDKEIEKVIALENKIKVLDDIVYKTSQLVQTMNMLNRNCKTSFVKPEFLKNAQRANPRLYDIGCYNDNLALMLARDSDETIRLAQESRSKLSNLIIPFDYDKLNNIYDLFVPQREKSSLQ
ncbi:hypothetical protein Tco_0977546 [Tanacetum coccineum]|uniref:CCHC-type domain-containing protein n=1 Tax=Tanacetum coccineum TaxID=301880 RepID=A0ABQ5EKM6_9ASTR